MMRSLLSSLSCAAWAAVVIGGAAVPVAAVASPSVYCIGTTFMCADPPVIGAVTSTSAVVWVHLDGSTTTHVRYRPIDSKLASKSVGGTTADDSDHTVKLALTGLTPSTTYVYEVGIVQPEGKETWSTDKFFRTQDEQPQAVAFSVVSDFANKLVASPALVNAATMHNDFLLIIGDMDHRNPAKDVTTGDWYPPGSTDALASMRKMHQRMRNPSTPIGSSYFASLVKSTRDQPQVPVYATWDDHDYCANNVGADCPFRDFAFQAWRENEIWSAESGLSDGSGCQSVYQRIPLGALADLFMLDARSGRDETTDPPTMLGACQRDWLLAALGASTATWKIILSPVPFNSTTKSYDSWGAFPAERQRILDQITALGMHNVIVLSGDIHSGGAYDDGTRSGVPEFSVPHANMPDITVDTYCREILVNGRFSYLDDEPGTWTIGVPSAPNAAQPPSCLGKQYAVGSVQVTTPGPYPLSGASAPGYMRVELTPTTATVRTLGADGVGRVGQLADGTSAPLTMTFVAQQAAWSPGGGRRSPGASRAIDAVAPPR